MNRHKFRTKNQLRIYSYLYIVLTLLVLLVVFLILGNLNTFVAWANLDYHVEAAQKTINILNSDMEEQAERFRRAREEAVQLKNTAVGVYGEGKLCKMIETQLDVMKQSWRPLEDLSASMENLQLIVVAKGQLSSAEIGWLTQQSEAGVHLFFLETLSYQNLSDPFVQELLGIKRVGKREIYPGMRISSELLGGFLEDKEAQVSTFPVELRQQTKVYAAALPSNYKEIENDDLPPLIWRYIASGETGNVYVCNGDFMETELCYGILPMILTEVQGSFLYPIVNAYCFIVDGFPYAHNESRESWERLYSRDAFGIQQDMLMPQFKRYAQVYNGKLTYFSDDYDMFMNSQDENLMYYLREIQSDQGLLARRENGELTLKDADDPVNICKWSTDFSFWNEQENKMQMPINFTVDVENTPNIFGVAGIINGLGYYTLRCDVDDFLDYDGTADIWMDYCSNLEVLLGTQLRDYDWLERVTAGEALNRIHQLLNMQMEVGYYDSHISVEIENFDQEAWFMLRTDHRDLKIDHGTIKEAGENCYLVTVTEPSAMILWGE